MPFICDGKEYKTCEEMVDAWRTERTKTLWGKFHYNLYTPLVRFLNSVYCLFRRRIPYFLKRIWGYLPILWNDTDYDYFSILQLLQYKLSRVRRDLEKYQNHTRWQRDAKRIRYAEYLLGLLMDTDVEIDEKRRKDISTRLWRHIDKYYMYWWT